MRILFMGTPEFARASLESLLSAGESVVAAVTQPDRPAGRKMELSPPPVKQLALERGLPVYQPGSLRTPEFAELLSGLAPELIVVAAYGKILPERALTFPKYGCVNVHASLLPQYRGAAPINAALMAGEAVAGITTIYMDAGIDTGDMILRRKLSVGELEDAGSLTARLAALGGQTLLETLELIKKGSAPRVPQDNSLATYAPKLDDAACRLDFGLDARSVVNKIRGLSPVPGAWALLGGRRVKMFAAAPLAGEAPAGEPGEVVSVGKEGIIVRTSIGAVAVTSLQIEGSRRMSASEALNGGRVKLGERLG